MIQNTKKKIITNPKNFNEFKDDDLAPKGKINHIVETDWPVKEAVPEKKRKIKKTQIARFP